MDYLKNRRDRSYFEVCHNNYIAAVEVKLFFFKFVIMNCKLSNKKLLHRKTKQCDKNNNQSY